MNKTFVIIVHFGSIEITISCLESIYSHSQIDVILVDNSQNGKLKEKIRKFKKVILITSKANLGFASANNLGITKAVSLGARYVLLLNNDTLIPPGFFRSLTSFADSSDADIVSPKIYFAPGFEFHKGRYKKNESGKVIWYAGGTIDWENIYATHIGVDSVDVGQFDSLTDTEFATGCGMLIKKEVIEDVGLFNEDYFLYYEDVDYSLRAIRKGFKVKYFPNVFIYHKNAAASAGPGSQIHIYYQTRNRLLFGFKYAKLRTKIALIRESIGQFLRGGVIKKAVSDFYLRRFGKAEL